MRKTEGPPNEMAIDWRAVAQELLNFFPRFLSFVSSDTSHSVCTRKKCRVWSHINVYSKNTVLWNVMYTYLLSIYLRFGEMLAS
jgi:hypothetical protein